MRRQKIISKLNSNAKNFVSVSQRNENKELSLRDNKSMRISAETKAKGNKDRNWKEVQCKTPTRENFRDKTKYRSKRDNKNSTNRFELL